MTSEDLENELLCEPFLPFQLRLVGGKTIQIPVACAAWLLPNAVLVFQNVRPGRSRADGYDVIALHKIERIEPFSPKSPDTGHD